MEGVERNEALTIATAVLLTLLLIAEGITILFLGSLRDEHMFIGMALIPPVALKMGSTGYRFARYYLGTPAYREKGPPWLPMRVFAPVLVVATVGVLATGIVLMALGHTSGTVLLLHKAFFVVWGAAFAIHFLGHLPRVVRALGVRRPSGAGVRTALVLATAGGGVALAIALLPLITGYRGFHHG